MLLGFGIGGSATGSPASNSLGWSGYFDRFTGLLLTLSIGKTPDFFVSYS
jgi:hypothetical protein